MRFVAENGVTAKLACLRNLFMRAGKPVRELSDAIMGLQFAFYRLWTGGGL